MLKEIAKKVYDATNSVITQNGYELADVELIKNGSDLELVLYIFKDTGISLDDCEKVHYLVEPIIDELDPTSGEPFSLSISSLGLLRPLKTTRDFERRLGKEVEIKLYAPNESKKKNFVGVLNKVDEDNIELSVNDKVEVIARKQIANAVLKIDF